MKRSLRLVLALIAIFALSAGPALGSVVQPPKRTTTPVHMIKKIVKPATAYHAAVTYTIYTQGYANSTALKITGIGGQVLVSGTLGLTATAQWAKGNYANGTTKAYWITPSVTSSTSPRPSGASTLPVKYDGGGLFIFPANATITETWTYQLAAANILGCGGTVTMYASMQVFEDGRTVGRRWHTAPGCMGAPGWDVNTP